MGIHIGLIGLRIITGAGWVGDAYAYIRYYTPGAALAFFSFLECFVYRYFSCFDSVHLQLRPAKAGLVLDSFRLGPFRVGTRVLVCEVD